MLHNKLVLNEDWSLMMVLFSPEFARDNIIIVIEDGSREVFLLNSLLCFVHHSV